MCKWDSSIKFTSHTKQSVDYKKSFHQRLILNNYTAKTEKRFKWKIYATGISFAIVQNKNTAELEFPQFSWNKCYHGHTTLWKYCSNIHPHYITKLTWHEPCFTFYASVKFVTMALRTDSTHSYQKCNKASKLQHWICYQTAKWIICKFGDKKCQQILKKNQRYLQSSSNP